jgi:diguanylate cyclase (GGDEF)-like protein/PAS domain S-box-containing protein
MAINKTRNQLTAYELRRLAEERLSTQPPERHLPGSDADNQKLIHELEVHQIELEMQNEELLQARDEIEKALETYTELYDFAPVGYITIGRNGEIRAVNLTGAALLGVERSKLTNKRFEQFVSREYRPLFTGFLDKVFASQNKEACELGLSSKGNNSLFVQIEAMATSSGQKCRIALIDITERKRLQTEIQQARHYAENIVETIRRPLLVLNSEQMVLSANQSFYRTFKTVPGATIGTVFHKLGNGQWDIPGLQKNLAELLSNDNEFTVVEVGHDFPEIGRRIITLNARRIISENPGSHNILLALEDITERKDLEVTLRHECTHDRLTGLYNRAFFDEELERLSQGRMFPLSFIMADINGLKTVNDTLGHKAGDQLIRMAARTIHGAFRAGEIVARIGGDEFVVILPETAADIAEEVVRRIRHSPEINDGQVKIAFGTATAANKNQVADAIKRADEKMYQDKAKQKES